MRKKNAEKNTGSKKTPSRIVYIPGWMDSSEFYGFGKGLDIWSTKTGQEDKIDTEFVVAHSAGAHFALLNWAKHRNTKLILVNPLLAKRRFRDWIRRWFMFSRQEGRKHFNWRRFKLFRYLAHGLRRLYFLLSFDIREILMEIPQDMVWIICGERDEHFYDKDSLAIARERGIAVIEVPEMGHVLDEEKVRKIIRQIMQKNS